MRKPAEFPRRVLVAVSGLSPQIVTETLYGLVTQETPFIPTEIHLLTTQEGAHRVQLDLLHQHNGKFHHFCRDYSMPAITFGADQIHILRDEQGQPMSDIRTPVQNERAADQITQLIAELSQDDEAAIHASIAGGRKTMGYYLGYALSLFGREQDRLSHVLVTEGYEGHPEFFYPTIESRVIYNRDKRPMDSQEAQVVLAHIPFVRLRDDVPENLLQGRAGFSETIGMARKAEQESELVIDRIQRTLTASGINISMPDNVMAFYVWLLRQTLDGERLARPVDYEPVPEYASRYLAEYEQLVDDRRSIEGTKGALTKGMDQAFFAEKITRINKLLNQQLGKRLARSYAIKNYGSRGSSVYATPLTPEQVEII